ncbi:hypothetical protein GLOTRDRAFT_93866 [Gloeophyllum trabeum ATCC 11539]|uniref:Uncharacterized protein n=1 Tax=Gloeophyllum trabeum (strain ATCC 11539 / FP-39264 / Madison 617) TaxID=670483 RepID=S7Q7B1_GLOTA|nr:uncharacterized protein GLOTRDRAFT_93866 [Gloeophyllum trabeum ATCC 11539]EPQ55417.1 hypothetical protein GLOTRDRAFT_93866 [Gloeophyllum trabeum ATCC 11539]
MYDLLDSRLGGNRERSRSQAVRYTPWEWETNRSRSRQDEQRCIESFPRLALTTIPDGRPPTREQCPPPLIKYSHSPESYMAALELVMPRQQARSLLDEVRAMAEKYLDMTKGVRQQRQDVWEGFIADTCARWPVFARYESAFPLRRYMSGILIKASARAARRATKSVISAKPGADARKEAPRKPYVDIVKRPITRSQVSNKGKIPPAKTSNPQSTRQTGDTEVTVSKSTWANSEASWPNASNAAAPSVAGPSVPSPSQTAPSARPAPTVSPSAEHTVQAFLRGLKPNLEYTYPVLRAYGITLWEDLEAFRCWSRESQEGVLRQFVRDEKLTGFECDVLLRALNTRAERDQAMRYRDGSQGTPKTPQQTRVSRGNDTSCVQLPNTVTFATGANAYTPYRTDRREKFREERISSQKSVHSERLREQEEGDVVVMVVVTNKEVPANSGRQTYQSYQSFRHNLRALQRSQLLSHRPDPEDDIIPFDADHDALISCYIDALP